MVADPLRVGGQTMPVSKMREVEARFGCPLIELWGMTELAGAGRAFPCNGPHKLGSIGIAPPYTEARIADSSNSGNHLKTSVPLSAKNAGIGKA